MRIISISVLDTRLWVKIGKLLVLGIIGVFVLIVVASYLFKEGGILSDVSPVLKDPYLTLSQVQVLRVIHTVTYGLMGTLAIIFFIIVALENRYFPYNRFQNFLIWLGAVLFVHGVVVARVTEACAHLAVSAAGTLLLFAGIYFRLPAMKKSLKER